MCFPIAEISDGSLLHVLYAVAICCMENLREDGVCKDGRQQTRQWYRPQNQSGNVQLGAVWKSLTPQWNIIISTSKSQDRQIVSSFVHSLVYSLIH